MIDHNLETVQASIDAAELMAADLTDDEDEDA